jgi:hypothetical protein
MLAAMQVVHLQEINQVIEHDGQKTYYNYFDIIARKPDANPHN